MNNNQNKIDEAIDKARNIFGKSVEEIKTSEYVKMGVKKAKPITDFFTFLFYVFIATCIIFPIVYLLTLLFK